VTDSWIDRREFHPDSPRLADLLSDPAALVEGRLAIGPAPVDAPWGDAERLWDRFLTGGVRAPGFRLVRLGSTLTRGDYCRSAPIGNEQVDDVVEPNRVLEHYTSGATVVLQALQFVDPVHAQLSTNLALALDHPVQVNAYLTPPAERGLDIHFDFHDVLVVQLAGAKRWHVWPPLPRTRRPVKRGPSVAQPTPDELGAPLLDRVLERGDCLAIPRGFPHAAESTDSESVHLTIGVMTLTWERVLRDVIDDTASGSALADRLPFGGLGGLRGADGPHPTDALAALSARVTTDHLRHAVAAEVWRRQPRTRLRPRRPVQIAADRPVSVTPGPLLWLDARPAPDSKHALHLGDRQLRFPADCTEFVAALLRSPTTFTGRSLTAALDEPSRITVLSRLATEGVLRG
jgi:lysine-specific demethylase/histidyl-hydroxylase NO66